MLNISVTTLRRKVTRGEISARITTIASGERWEISHSEIDRALAQGPVLARTETLHSGAGESPKSGGSPNPGGDPTSIVSSALALSNRLLDELAAEREARENDRKLIEREQRRVEALSLELRSYQRILGEQAESLNEERARRLAAEQRNESVNQPVIVENVYQVDFPVEIPAAMTHRKQGGWSRFKRLLGFKVQTG